MNEWKVLKKNHEFTLNCQLKSTPGVVPHFPPSYWYLSHKHKIGWKLLNHSHYQQQTDGVKSFTFFLRFYALSKNVLSQHYVWKFKSLIILFIVVMLSVWYPIRFFLSNFKVFSSYCFILVCKNQYKYTVYININFPMTNNTAMNNLVHMGFLCVCVGGDDSLG